MIKLIFGYGPKVEIHLTVQEAKDLYVALGQKLAAERPKAKPDMDGAAAAATAVEKSR